MRDMIHFLCKSLRPRIVFSQRVRLGLRFDWLRIWTRLRHHLKRWPVASDKLHLGCGKRLVPGWLNSDIRGSDFDVDLACGWLPWEDHVFSAIVCQQVIEHLDLNTELVPLLKELRRASRPGAEIWLACPDMAKICEAYCLNHGADLLSERIRRWPSFSLDGAPTQQVINVFFHQDGEHKNLFDFDLLDWALRTAGFTGCEARTEQDVLSRFPEFKLRGDDDCSIYVCAHVPSPPSGATVEQIAVAEHADVLLAVD